MKRILVAAFVAFTIAPQPASGALRAAETPEIIEIEPDAQVTVANINGTIEIRTWDRAAVRVSARYDDAEAELVFRRDGAGARVEIRSKVENHSSVADLVVDVPARAKLDVKSVNARVRMKTAGDARLKTVNGDAEIDTTGARLRIESVNGEVEVRGKTLAIEARSVSGRLDVKAETITELEAKSVSGDVRIEAGDIRPGRYAIKSHSGTVKLALPPSRVRVEVKSFQGGKTIGDANAEAVIEVKTFSGDVDLVGASAGASREVPVNHLPPGFVSVL